MMGLTPPQNDGKSHELAKFKRKLQKMTVWQVELDDLKQQLARVESREANRKWRHDLLESTTNQGEGRSPSGNTRELV